MLKVAQQYEIGPSKLYHYRLHENARRWTADVAYSWYFRVEVFLNGSLLVDPLNTAEERGVPLRCWKQNGGLLVLARATIKAIKNTYPTHCYEEVYKSLLLSILWKVQHQSNGYSRDTTTITNQNMCYPGPKSKKLGGCILATKGKLSASEFNVRRF